MHHEGCHRCWTDLLTEHVTDHACDCDACVPLYVTRSGIDDVPGDWEPDDAWAVRRHPFSVGGYSVA